MSALLFELPKAEKAEGGVQTLAIVSNLNVFKYRCACLGMSSGLTDDTLRFECTKETFCNGIIIAVPNSAQLDIAVCQTVLVVSTGILATLIRMIK